MIFYFFNSYYPDKSGFALRCQREIDQLSKFDQVIVVCRGRDNEPYEQVVSANKRIVRFFARHPVVDNPKAYKPNGFYEFVRNLDLILNSAFVLLHTMIHNNNKQSKKLFCTVSPLTIPLVGWVAAKLSNCEPTVVAFHDLEPELAIHIKKLKKNSFILQVEFLLEKFACKSFKKVLVTNKSQAQVILSRTGIADSKIYSIHNALTDELEPPQNSFARTSSSEFILFYSANFTYSYTSGGLSELLEHIRELKNDIPNLKLYIAGGGDNLKIISKYVSKLELSDFVTVLDKSDKISNLMNRATIGLIPWKREQITETILPTKLFEYLQTGLVVIAPNFGCFKQALVSDENSLLFDSIKEIPAIVKRLYNNSDLQKKISLNGRKLYQSNYTQTIANEAFASFWKTT